jgi:hypothetical protein
LWLSQSWQKKKLKKVLHEGKVYSGHQHTLNEIHRAKEKQKESFSNEEVIIYKEKRGRFSFC